jgi:tRNA(Ile)-lysidine synthase
LITAYRQAILAYLEAEGIPWVQDSSNTHHTYLRNRVRLDLLPTLQQYNPQIVKRLNKLADILRAEQHVLEQHTEGWAAQVLSWRAGKSMLAIWCGPFSAAPVAIQRRLVRRVLEALLVPTRGASFQHTENLRRFILVGSTGQRLTLPGKLLAERHADRVLVWDTQTLLSLTPTLTLPIPGEVEIPGLGLCLRADLVDGQPDFATATPRQVFVDLERMGSPVTVRFWQPGDRFYPLGAPGWKKLQDFFTDQKVPRVERPYVPLVVSGAEIVWVVGYRVAESCKIRPETRRVLRLQCDEK